MTSINSDFRNFKVPHHLSECVLRELAGADEIPVLAVPVFQTVVIEQFNALVDDERHDAKPQALFEHNKPPDPAVSVLERVYLLESRVEFHDVLE